jgi:hypothetical protein
MEIMSQPRAPKAFKAASIEVVFCRGWQKPFSMSHRFVSVLKKVTTKYSNVFIFFASRFGVVDRAETLPGGGRKIKEAL